MRSVVVVFPASMCAMMPMFRVFSNGVVRGINPLRPTNSLLPPVMSERLVRFSHPVRIVLLLNRIAAVVRGVHQLSSELFFHRFLASRPRVRENPTDAQGGPPVRPDFNGHL